MSNYKRYFRSEVRIDLSQLRRNAELLMQRCTSDCMQMAVIKANAYGHGAIPVAKALRNTVDWFAVATVNEGIELRDAGINLPVLVLGPPHRETADYYEQFQLTATVSAIEHISLLTERTEYHINIDTGMNRLGVRYDELAPLQEAMQQGRAQAKGIMTHFATADNDDDLKVKEQYQRFEKVRAQFDQELLTHVANTGAMSFYDNTCFDMVRTGIGLYGYTPGKSLIDGIKPVLEWVTKVEHVHRIKEGESVSYGATWTAPSDRWIATLPIGYADGVPRLLSNQFYIRIGDQTFPSVGTVTMDYIMIDLGEEKIPVGTEVQILGQKAMDAGEWAALCSTIPYEILTDISERVKRSYFDK